MHVAGIQTLTTGAASILSLTPRAKFLYSCHSCHKRAFWGLLVATRHAMTSPDILPPNTPSIMPLFPPLTLSLILASISRHLCCHPSCQSGATPPAIHAATHPAAYPAIRAATHPATHSAAHPAIHAASHPVQLMFAIAAVCGVFVLVPRGVTLGSIQVR